MLQLPSLPDIPDGEQPHRAEGVLVQDPSKGGHRHCLDDVFEVRLRQHTRVVHTAWCGGSSRHHNTAQCTQQNFHRVAPHTGSTGWSVAWSKAKAQYQIAIHL